MNNLDKQYQALLQDILDNGVTKQDRTGTGTLSVFGRQIRHDMKAGFPLLTTKKMYFKGIVTELLWFLRGDTNIKYLVDNDCHIWDGDAYKRYLVYTIEGVKNGFDRIKGYLDDCLVEFDGSYEHFSNPSFQYGYRPHTQEEFINKIKTDDEFAKTWGDLGPVYGKQWRNWELGAPDDWKKEWKIDQIANSINLLKTDPDSRRNRVSSWNVGELEDMVLPPCHTDFQFFTRELSNTERMKYAVYTNDSYDLNGELVSPLTIDWELTPTRAISLMFNMRSNDVPLGLPFNIASYGLLLEIIAKEVNMVPDELIASLGDAHIYKNQIDGVKEQLTRESYPLPNLVINDEFWNHDVSLIDQINYIEITDFEIRDYQSHPTIKFPLSN